jgi:carboxyl-terminal processing protease
MIVTIQSIREDSYMKKLRIVLLVLALAASALLPATKGIFAQDEEPYVVRGRYLTTSPTAIESAPEIQVVMADLGSEVKHDPNLESDPNGVIVGTATGQTESGTYRFNLPIKPLGPLYNLDKDAPDQPGVGVYALFYGDNSTGGDITVPQYYSGMGSSASWDEVEQRINGGKIFVWSPVDGQRIPSGFGDDKTLFTEDDPLVTVPKGWTMLDLGRSPFAQVRTGELTADMIEGGNALIDYSKLSYKDAWDKLYERGVDYYAFTKLKNMDWPAIKAKIDPLIAAAKDDFDFAEAIRAFVLMFNDTHTAVSPISAFSGKTLAPLLGEVGIADMVITSDDTIVVKYVDKRGPAGRAGMVNMAVITQVNGKPVIDALDATTTLYTSASTVWARRYTQLLFFLRDKPNTKVTLTFANPGEAEKTADIKMRQSRYIANVAPDGATKEDPTELVATAKILPSGIGYIKLRNFYQHRPLEYRLFKTYLKSMIDAKVPGIIIDDRDNSGGWSDTSSLLAGFFYKEKTPISIRQNSDGKGNFKTYYTQDIVPQAPYFDGPVAVLVNANSVSSGDFFAYYIKNAPNGFVVGDTPTAGAGGGIQSFKLPGGLDFQWAESPVVTLSGENLLEGKGVEPDIKVDLTVDAIRTGDDNILKAAEAKIKEGGFKR